MEDLAPDFSRPTSVNMDWNSGVGTVEYNQGDRGLLVAFRWERVKNDAKSAEQGRPIWERVPFVRIQHIGDQTTIIERPVKTTGFDDDRRRFPRQWNAFLHNQVDLPNGTPTSVLFPNQPDIVGNLQSWGIHVVEQLADVNSHGIASMGMGAQEWQNKAKRYLEDAKRGVDHHAFETYKKNMERELRVRDNQIQELISQINKLTDALANQSIHVQGVIGQQVVTGIQQPPQTNPFPFSAPMHQPPRQQTLEEILRPAEDVVVGPLDPESIAPPPGFFSGDVQSEQIAANHPSELVLQRRPRTRQTV
jgi:hypothetical protein